MAFTLHELQMYKNFDELAKDMLELATEILPDQMLYISSFTDKEQVIMKMTNPNPQILVAEGMSIDLERTICKRVDFERNYPLVYEDVEDAMTPEEIRRILGQVNIKSYLGLPISLVNGQRFGTLCAVHNESSTFDAKSIDLLQRLVRMFSYYLELESVAYRDALTALYNRHYLAKYFENHSEKGGSIFFLDLDGFKEVNDEHGHDVGDLVLKEVALRLEKIAYSFDEAFVVRLGGDEFIFYFPEILNREELGRRAELVLEGLSSWGDDYKLSTSIGIASFPAQSGPDLTILLKNADEALYQSKSAGKNTYTFFEK
ncbi:sensor domain-containing diguanylate cyclase [Planomicrobium sp. YIM 101495]|uniref:sensor domain-containing diguanylate cyclase n=1 Tax=Planomicrobium sp. YIM 101495 TaxID=2665160 RepID=UPI0012B8D6CB|nr:sensor domain-containing diguanylate cyclase [Planomicrobium sp. YIM 101495]MTD31848.1 diguanylate cyclase [Planomicrobium sp. YIM 101495]